ncbi:hypothetical protein JCM6882_006375, partial [Rhodosporidiobolus microsporus]
MKTSVAAAVVSTAAFASFAAALPFVQRDVVEGAYDFVVVGGGTAGLTVASRLATDTNATILLLEAGGAPSEYDLPWLNPAQTGELEGSPIDWNFTSQTVKGVGNREIRQNRGKALGGTSSMNGMTYGRGSKVVIDQWSELNNDSSWAWDSVQSYYQKTFQLVPPNDTSAYRTYDPSLYSSTGGPAFLGYNDYNPPSIDGFVEACSAINISAVEDLNDGNNLGVKHELGTFNPLNQTRSSSYTAFYPPAYASPNFEGVTHAFVEKIIFDESNGTTRATGVRYSKYDSSGKKRFYTVEANNEVIVSAGALQSPQLLMVSGVGPRDELEKHGIEVIVENEWVGKNLQETTSSSLISHAHPNASTSALYNPTKTDYLAAAEYEYYTNRTGPLTAWDGITGPAFSFQSLDNDTLIEFGAEDLLNRSSAAHIEMILWTSAYPNTSMPDLPSPRILDPKSNYITISVYLLQPLSRGRIGLLSASMEDQPAIHLNFYDDYGDMRIHVEAFKRARKVAAHPAF